MRILLALALLALAAPLASAGPVTDAAQQAVQAGAAAGQAAACGEGPTPPAACHAILPLLASLERVPLAEAGPAVVDATTLLLCSHPDHPLCRVVSGRPLMEGAFDLCASSPSPNAPLRGPYWYVVHGGTWTLGAVSITVPYGADPTLASATSAAFAGTPLEGESICHDHRPTLRALAALP
ncbi:MAG TPA: hypothetical protein VFH78_04280 [Candidatus Thermoplasmatota archaeon]|nr:hypothetical protein [Candidatus Thermoplasmatota archaeon]